MPKRLHDTEVWKKRFTRSLPSGYKLLWLYVLDACDHAGIWDVDMEIAQVYTGAKLKETTALDLFNGRIQELENGDKWFIPDFITFQYGHQLNQKNNAHRAVITRLQKYGLLTDDMTLKQGATQPLPSPCPGVLDKDKDKDKDKEKVQDQDKDKGPHLFRNSPYHNEQAFVEKMMEDQRYACFDLPYYHEAMKVWSDQGKMKKNWIATAKSWMLRDLKKGEAKLMNGNRYGSTDDIDNWGH